MNATLSGSVYTVTYGTALAAGTYTTQVKIRGLQATGLTIGNTTAPIIVTLTSTNTAFTFQFMNLANGAALTPTLTPLVVDYITMPIN